MKLGGQHGIYAEPAAAAALAGVIAAREVDVISANDRVLSMVTGSGLKDTKAAIQAGGKPISIKPDIDNLAAALQGRGV